MTSPDLVEARQLAEKLRELLDKASALPWRYIPGLPDWGSAKVTGSVWGGTDQPLTPIFHKPNTADAMLVVEVVNALPALLSVLDALGKQEDRGTTAEPSSVGNGAALIAAERSRQVAEEGWDASHDDEHSRDELAWAAASYAIPVAPGPLREGERPEFQREDGLPTTWPWEPEWWKPTPEDRVRELVKAGALIAAEIDRLHRAALSSSDSGHEKGQEQGGGTAAPSPVVVEYRREIDLRAVLVRAASALADAADPGGAPRTYRKVEAELRELVAALDQEAQTS